MCRIGPEHRLPRQYISSNGILAGAFIEGEDLAKHLAAGYLALLRHLMKKLSPTLSNHKISRMLFLALFGQMIFERQVVS
jgi:hypothetical protein